MTKCTHEKVCHECVRAEIKELEARISELRNKIPTPTNTYISMTPQYVPNYPNPFIVYTQTSYTNATNLLNN